MDDFGKILFELHAARYARDVIDRHWSLTEAEANSLKWENVHEDIKQAWRNTAQEFIQFLKQ